MPAPSCITSGYLEPENRCQEVGHCCCNLRSLPRPPTCHVEFRNNLPLAQHAFVAISSNDVENYPDDAPDLMTKVAAEQNFPFPYLYDESQEVARAYDAACTPDFYIFDSSKALVYRGQLDDSRPENGIPVTGKDMRSALDAMTNQKEISSLQKPSIGCNIKWKS